MYPANTLQAECYVLSLTSTAGRTSRVLLDDVIPWINKASLVLYIAHTQRAMLRPIRCSEGCMVSSPVIENCLSRSRIGLKRHINLYLYALC